jgi:hypothetical protein
MTQREKLRQRIEQNPKTVRFQDLDRLLTVSIPRRRPYVLPIYVKLALAAIDQAEKEDEHD